MAIYNHQYGDLSYYRVFRAWGGQEHQEYIRIKRSRDAAYKKALEVDERLAKAQKAFTAQQALSPSYHLRENGQIRGLRRIIVKRKGRNPSEAFELRINVPWEDDIRRTTISISVHGEQKAFLLAIEKICEWYGLKVKSELGQSLQSSLSAYTPLNTKSAAEPSSDKTLPNEPAAVTDLVIKKAKSEFTNLTDGIFKGLKRFTA
jgi:hypothetical protein|tara:strand:+ start:3490 stop:4101 length:612 start_codon:yes stop_codon:yes gene_type:complete